jgi:hypothetical protein
MWIDLRNFDEKEIRNTVVVGDYSVRQETKAEAQAKQKHKPSRSQAEVSGGRPGSSSSTITNSILESGRRGSRVEGRPSVRWYGGSASLSTTLSPHVHTVRRTSN